VSVPTEPGWYWWRMGYGPLNEWEPALVEDVELGAEPRVWVRQRHVAPLSAWGGEWGPRIPPPGEKPVYGVSWSSMDFQCLGCGAASDMVEVCAHEDGCAHGGSGYRTLPSPARLAALEELAAKEPVEMAEGWARCHYCHSLVGDICLHSPDCPWLRAQPAPEAE